MSRAYFASLEILNCAVDAAMQNICRESGKDQIILRKRASMSSQHKLSPRWADRPHTENGLAHSISSVERANGFMQYNHFFDTSAK